MATIGFFLFSLLLVLYVLSQGIILGSFRNLESRAAQEDVERVRWALNDRLFSLNNMASDWAPGNRTNMTSTVLSDLKLNLFAVADSSGKLVFGLSSGIPLPGNFTRTPWNGLLAQRLKRQKFGILLLPTGALLIAARPIVTNNHHGSAGGTLIMGRMLDRSSISALSRSVRLALSVRRVDDPGLPSDFKRASASFIGGSPSFTLSTSETVSGYALWRDVERKPALILRVDSPRTIYRKGLDIVHYFALVIFTAGLAFGGAMLLLLEKMVLARLARLNASVQEIGASGQLSLRVPVSGNDELSDLSTAVNEMLSFLESYDIDERKQAEERIEHLAWHDALTDLPNRLLFQDRLGMALARAIRYGEQVAVMMLDLDRFKEINNTLGHETGDQLLRAIAKRLMACVRRNNTVARMSGDEFFFILPDIREDQDAGRMAARILKIFQRPFLINDHEIYITPSIGISLYPSDGEIAESLMQNADLAMYQA
ncbi:MAG TPA: diguanylate cyclase, partial [Chroococcales cyanobacterium]